VLAKAKQRARLAAWLAAVERQLLQPCRLPPGPLHATLVFHPPNRAPRDLDGLHASMKAPIDGVFAALGRDDGDIHSCAQRWGEVWRGAPGVELRLVPERHPRPW